MRRYYEFAIAITLIGALSFALLRALDSVRDDMEEAIVQSEAANQRLGLVEALVHHEAFGGKLLQSSNPVDWVANKPANYLGEFDVVPDVRSAWYFDRQTGELAYRFHDGHLARFRLSHGGANVDGRIVISGISLQRLDKQHE